MQTKKYNAYYKIVTALRQTIITFTFPFVASKSLFFSFSASAFEIFPFTYRETLRFKEANGIAITENDFETSNKFLETTYINNPSLKELSSEDITVKINVLKERNKSLSNIHNHSF